MNFLTANNTCRAQGKNFETSPGTLAPGVIAEISKGDLNESNGFEKALQYFRKSDTAGAYGTAGSCAR